MDSMLIDDKDSTFEKIDWGKNLVFLFLAYVYKELSTAPDVEKLP